MNKIESARCSFSCEAVSRQGPRHIRNEDAFLVALDTGLFAVADGMGGHRDGHLASRSFVDELKTLKLDGAADIEEKLQRIDAAFHRVNERLFGSYLADPESDISGCTGLTLTLHENYAGCLWVGDSRLYLLRRGHLFLVSEDHSDTAGRLTRALGAAEDMDVERRIIRTEPGDTFVLCTDGLFKGADEELIANTLAEGSEGAADRLLARAIAGGTSDDITLVVAWVDFHE
ncbi:protein serine/threonine phosphatase 2C family protein [Roseibium denhamense]|uniref:Serine/threonine protein phosphatase Stp1 n=1 Tax=Roseibium denhamense TaxID=76305 RepID=A0ABY1NWN4_9HYPH|nr:PP2C family protein-serine/threonine phosphatase [Roseibium denhamense]MTI04859.1 protein serine/threonine phosphatase 2C family protein [Roseibium denhamense]SMP19980.1 serine/threonine protein phosphatase Stp1 [Roseibium denhamense]